MDFLKYIATPAETTEIAPLVTKLKLTKGRMAGGFLYFPYGPAGTLHVIAKIGIHQILPFNTGSNYCMDDTVINFSLGIDLINPPYELDIITWNTSTTLSHALTFCVYLDPIIKRSYTADKLKGLIPNA